MREQATLLAISHILASTLEFQPGLILDQLHEIIEFTNGGLFKLENSALAALAMHGKNKQDVSAPTVLRLNTSESIEVLLNKNLPLRISDMWSDDPRAQFLRSLFDDETSILLEGMHSWMWVPLAVKGRSLGGIALAHEKINFFTDHHAALAMSVADQASITLVNAELNEQAQALAVMEERQTLAHNLHDAVNQSLFSAGLIAEVLPRLWEQDQEAAQRSLKDLHRLTRGAQAEMRALLAELRPSTLTDSKLSDLLRQLGTGLADRADIQVAVTASAEIILPPKVQIAFYRMCQEALNNIAKHSQATHVEIDLQQDDIAVELRIGDNGVGFDPEQTISGHYGLGMMRERAEAARLLMTITSKAGQGAKLKIRWTGIIPKESV